MEIEVDRSVGCRVCLRPRRWFLKEGKGLKGLLALALEAAMLLPFLLFLPFPRMLVLVIQLGNVLVENSRRAVYRRAYGNKGSRGMHATAFGIRQHFKALGFRMKRRMLGPDIHEDIYVVALMGRRKVMTGECRSGEEYLMTFCIRIYRGGSSHDFQ